MSRKNKHTSTELNATVATGPPPLQPKKSKAAEKPKHLKSTKPKHPKAKMTFSRNVLPPILGILMFVGVLGLLNAQWLIAQYQYRFMKAVPEIGYSTAPATADPNAPAHIYIPMINVSAPIVTDVKSYDSAAVQLGLRRGPLQYGSSVDPGHKGNLVIVGHSSGQLWAPGGYKFVFTLLDKMALNDRILVDYKGNRYIYRVSETKVVPPTDLSVVQPTTEPQLTLITCTPVGTSKNRRVIIARQVSPKPSTAIDAPAAKPVTAQAIPN